MPYTLLPQPKSITREVLERGIRSSYPPGSFNFEEGSRFDQKVKWKADAYLPLYQFLQTVQDELNPGLATDSGLLSNWVAFTVDPRCYDLPNLTQSQRQELVVAALKGGDPGLTKAQLDTALANAFPNVSFSPSDEISPLRIGDGLTVGRLFINDFSSVVIKPAAGTGSIVLTRIECYVGSILPNYTVFFVQVQT